jgi:hypothetical protein
MSRRRVRLIGALCLTIAACGSTAPTPKRHREPPAPVTHPATPAARASSPAKPAKLAIGLADNDTEFLTDRRFLALGIRFVRDEIPWNALLIPSERQRLTRWLDEARADHLTVLVTFDHAAPPLRYTLPTVEEFSTLFERFRATYPWVTEFVTWNESNYYGEPTSTHPARAARYYLALRRDCPSCTILAPDLLDITDRRYAVDEVKWARELIRALGFEPAIWALNNYVGANSLSTRTTARLLAAVRGAVWFVETAGIVSEPNRAAAATAANLAHQASVDRFILGPLAHLSPRIQRVYLYQWQLPGSDSGWDSALISANGVPRPAYYALAQSLAASGIEPDCALSSIPPACVRH